MVARITGSKRVHIHRDQPVRLALSEEFELIRIEAQTLFPEDRLSMMPKLEEVLGAVMTRVVKDLFDPLTGQIEELTQKFQDLQTADNLAPWNRPLINLSLPLRPLGPYDTFACVYLEAFLSGAALVFYKQRKQVGTRPQI